MIKVTKLNGQMMVINANLIEFLEESPDTIITLTTGKKIVVREDAESIIERVTDYRRACLRGVQAGAALKEE
jgi:flagellar protein FlbD